MSNLARVLSDHQCMLPRAIVDVFVRTLSLEPRLPEGTVTTNKGLVPSSTERGMAAHTVTNDEQEMAGACVESESDASDYKLQVP